MQRRLWAVLACCAAMAAGACGEAEGVEVQPLPPLRRPTPEMRAGLPEVRGVWRFTGFEIPAGDTTAVREQVYTLTPPGELRVITQRLDSIAGQYVREGVAFPFVGEVRRDSAVSVVAFSEGIGQFAAGRVVRDTLWVELTSFTSAQTWPRGTRAALVRGTPRAPFRRLLGGAPITPPVDSVALRDSIRMDSLRRAGVVVPPAGTVPPATGQPLPGAQPTVPGVQPGAVQRPPAQTVPAQRPPAQAQPQQRPPASQPRPQQPRPQQPRPQPQRPPAEQPPVNQPVNEPVQQPTPSQPAPNPNAPRDTIRFGGQP